MHQHIHNIESLINFFSMTHMRQYIYLNFVDVNIALKM